MAVVAENTGITLRSFRGSTQPSKEGTDRPRAVRRRRGVVPPDQRRDHPGAAREGDRVPRRRCRSAPSGRAAGSLARTSSICPRSSSGPSPSRGRDGWSRSRWASGRRSTWRSTPTDALRRVLKPIIETLAGVPSVVMGFFALSVISPDFVKKLFSSAGTFSLLAAGIGVGILTVPLVASVAEDAMYAVPGALREAAYGIGARRRSVTTKVVFPAAASGHRRGRDPRHLTRDRRDDGGGDRGRRDRAARCGRSTSSARARR